MTDQDESIRLAMVANARAAKRALKADGVTWDIVPSRRWDAIETADGWIVSGSGNVFDMGNGANAITQWRVRAGRFRMVA